MPTFFAVMLFLFMTSCKPQTNIEIMFYVLVVAILVGGIVALKIWGHDA
ncbi:hypothetical protein P256_00044 [Acinetobacter nectaris CIP 110549]|uniref:Uncharacterized protein n=1 Tax=Acinetobacter nectaris CIP 110549 TaxID=1392540 RepID=V2V0H9_9GAMM|nr:hypothetical protein [Acinetobacter nectaris]ESK40278.1 hypothetical protein P256_00725 [Acinetobacter nectaris CIP 110549]ESK41059.1 hypothetical protein P256_00044 [Acinetobacter nectaris CIP 110549]